MVRLRLLLAALVFAVGGRASALPPADAAEPAWAQMLRTRVEIADARFAGEIGLYVEHLGRGEAFSHRAEENWYLASGVKVPVAIAVLRRVERGELALDTRICLQEEDFVDGAGGTNAVPAGTPLRVSYLLEQMIVYSDNTATDVLIRTVGLDEVNAIAHEVFTAQGLVITTLADVRRRTYAMMHARASSLSASDLLALRRAAAGPARMQRLAELLSVQPAEFLLPDLDSAFEAYYATNANAAPLRDYGRMLATLVNGLALAPEGTDHLLGLMSRVKTGKHRIRARLPPESRFAHKTGTQHRRACDLGIVTTPVAGGEARVVVAACTRGATSLAAGERALREVGAAITASGVLTLATPD